jgi:hypothetical protein
MLLFCDYNIGDHFGHWLAIGRTADPAKPIMTCSWESTRRQSARRGDAASLSVRYGRPTGAVNE